MHDQPVTDKELDQFYGVEVSRYKRNQAIKAAKASYDADDLSNDAYDCFQAINEALEDGDVFKAGCILNAARQATIARQASRLAYGVDQPYAITARQCFDNMLGNPQQALRTLTVRGAA
jgi:hypothetical protein